MGQALRRRLLVQENISRDWLNERYSFEWNWDKPSFLRCRTVLGSRVIYFGEVWVVYHTGKFKVSHTTMTTLATFVSAALVASSTTHFEKLLAEELKFKWDEDVKGDYTNILAARGITEMDVVMVV